jgi:hypothetical protein
MRSGNSIARPHFDPKAVDSACKFELITAEPVVSEKELYGS